MSTNVQREFNQVIKKLDLPTPTRPTRKTGVLNSRLQRDVDTMKNLLINNLVGEMDIWSGFFDEKQFKDAKAKLDDVIKELGFESKAKEIKAYFDTYTKIMKAYLENHIVVKAQVKTMPFKLVYMHKVPKIYENDKNKIEVNAKPIGYIVELPYQIERSAVYGEMKDQKPLFAPIIGNLDLDWTPPDDRPAPGEKEYILDFELQSRFFEAFDKQTTRTSVWRYQNYGRKGEPICDMLMANEDLMISMERIISEVDSKDFKASASVCGVMYGVDGRTIVGIVDYGGVHKNAFEALFKLTAYLEEAPRKGGGAVPTGGPGAPGIPGTPAPSGMGVPVQSTQPSLPTWTEEELANRPNAYAGSPVSNMPTWTEEELENRPDKFTGGGPNLPVWTEEELAELAKQSGPSLNLPEWEDDKDMIFCPECGYGCQPSWTECPICNASLSKEGRE